MAKITILASACLYFLGVITGCSIGNVEMSYEPFDESKRPPSEFVQVYMDKESIDTTYIEIGIITADDQGWGYSEPELIRHLRASAAKIGADAIVLLDSEEKAGAYVPTSVGVIQLNEKTLRALAIEFTGTADK